MPGERAPKSPTPVLFVLLLAGVSFALSQTLVVPALPSISKEFGASATATSWVLTGFLLSASVATPIVGKLGDLFGKGRVLTIVLLLFALGGTVCALAGSIGVLIGGRVIQGVAGGLVLLVLWTRFEAGRQDPLIDLGILAERAVATTNLTGFLIGFAMFSSFLLIPQFAQASESTGYGFGASVTEAGLLLFPAAIAQLIAGPLAGRLGVVIGFRTTPGMGAGFAAAAFCLLAVAHAQPWEFVVAGALLGAGISFAFASMANLIVGAVPQSQVGIATGINTVTRTVGGAFGAAVATAILAGHTLAGTPVPTEGAYEAAFLMSAVGALLAIGAALLVPTRAAEAAASRAAEASASA